MWKLVAAALAAVVVALLLWAPAPPGLPGLGSLTSLWESSPSYAPLDERRINVAVARFENDGWTESGARLIVGTLQEFPELNVVRLERALAGEELADKPARHAKAVQYLRESGADVAIWGTVSGEDGGRAVVSVTMAPATVMETRWRRYEHPPRIDFPDAEFDTVQPVLRLLAAQLAVESRLRRGDPATDEVASFVDEVRERMNGRAVAAWKSPDRGIAWAIAGNALNLSGTSLQRVADLDAAVDAYNKALAELPREPDALAWGRVQNNLANVLLTRGTRDNKPELLQQAVAAYKTALSARARDRAPLDWAATQSNLATALHVLGERQDDKASLQAAVAAYRAALEERSPENTPQEWGSTQANLASVLQTLGEREAGTQSLEDAIGAYYAALSVQSPKKTPLEWAATQNNLASALQALGARERSAERLAEAVRAYRAALTERRRERAPDEWATTHNNLGNALQTLAIQTGDNTFLREAVTAYRDALEERTREKSPHAWAETQNNLGAALKMLGERETVPSYLEEAAQAYEAALEELSRERTPVDWAATQNNLGNVLSALGSTQGNADLLCRALRHHVNAWRAFSAEAPRFAAVAAESLRQDRRALDTLNTRQTRKCIENYADIWNRVGTPDAPVEEEEAEDA
jgi:tetratricopeptide (TPR) repeat protein